MNLLYYDLRLFIGQNYFGNDVTQNYLVFQPLIKYFEVPKTINPWKSKGLSNEIIKLPATKTNSLNPKLDYSNIPKFQVKF